MTQISLKPIEHKNAQCLLVYKHEIEKNLMNDWKVKKKHEISMEKSNLSRNIEKCVTIYDKLLSSGLL